MYSKFLLSFVFLSAAFAASPAIGIVSASGHFTVEHSEVWGNSTLFDGNTIETGKASSELSLHNGVRVQLAAASRARVWENRVLLEKGVGQIVAPGAYEIDAGGLKIQAGSARLRVGVTDRVEVASISGTGRVSSTSGFLLASIPARRSMSFSMQAGSSGTVSRTGCLLYKDGHFILQDENTQEVVELSGNTKDLAANTGNRVEAVGTASGSPPSVSIATLLLTGTSVTQKSQGGCLSAASALNAQTEAPAGAGGATTPASTTATTTTSSGGGMSTGAKVGIAAAIIGGGAGAAIALAGKRLYQPLVTSAA